MSCFKSLTLKPNIKHPFEFMHVSLLELTSPFNECISCVDTQICLDVIYDRKVDSRFLNKAFTLCM